MSEQGPTDDRVFPVSIVIHLPNTPASITFLQRKIALSLIKAHLKVWNRVLGGPGAPMEMHSNTAGITALPPNPLMPAGTISVAVHEVA